MARRVKRQARVRCQVRPLGIAGRAEEIVVDTETTAVLKVLETSDSSGQIDEGSLVIEVAGRALALPLGDVRWIMR